MLQIAALILVLVASTYGQHQLTIVDNGKLCTRWISLTDVNVFLPYEHSNECTGPVLPEEGFLEIRFCCQSPATTTTTRSPTGPRKCGKQRFPPLQTRIVGGVQANRNSWVRKESRI